MLTEVTWKEAVIRALRRAGGQSSPTGLYRYVIEFKGRGMEEKRVKHAIRSVLDALKKDGRVEHVDTGLWKLK